ncbi:MAG TPA: dynamin family protein [Hyphomicrobiaceae bacterium]|jgi:predicted GTPase|nr:dynamin family protein [Hyphomicrobiaceae bacterium]
MSEVAHVGSDSGEQRSAAGFGDTPILRAGARERPVRVAVIGEFNSGKTSLVNALLGADVLPTSFITHTPYPTVIRFAAKPSLSAEIAQRRRVPFAWEHLDRSPSHHIHRLHVGMPLDRLRHLRPIDTPGLGLGDEVLEARTLRACRSADTIVWCTPAMQAWKASEHQAWLALPRAVRRRGILAVTFMDALRSQSDEGRLMARLQAEAGALFRKIVTISAHEVPAALRRDLGAVGI